MTSTLTFAEDRDTIFFRSIYQTFLGPTCIFLTILWKKVKTIVKKNPVKMYGYYIIQNEQEYNRIEPQGHRILLSLVTCAFY